MKPSDLTAHKPEVGSHEHLEAPLMRCTNTMQALRQENGRLKESLHLSISAGEAMVDHYKTLPKDLDRLLKIEKAARDLCASPLESPYELIHKLRELL